MALALDSLTKCNNLPADFFQLRFTKLYEFRLFAIFFHVSLKQPFNKSQQNIDGLYLRMYLIRINDQSPSFLQYQNH